MQRLLVVTASVRPGRIGPTIAEWVPEAARADGRFELDVADLAELALPFMDEPRHPALRDYEHEHTKAWSARVAAADAIVFVVPEYNHSFAPSLKNAIDYLVQEWFRKPHAFVSYGGVSGGTRAVAAIGNVTGFLGMVRTARSVEIPYVKNQLDEQGFHPHDGQREAIAVILDELAELGPVLAPMQKR